MGKFEQKKNFFTRYTQEEKSPKCTKMHTKKRGLMTWYRYKRKNLEFPSKIEFIYTVTHGKEITKKVHKKNTWR